MDGEVGYYHHDGDDDLGCLIAFSDDSWTSKGRASMGASVDDLGRRTGSGPVTMSILERLAARHADATFVGECAMGSRQNGCRRLDAWVLLKTWSPPTTIGYEVKVSRGDFLGDRKWQEYLPVCHELYFACPPKLIQPEELPQDVGLLWTAGETRLITKRRAVRREPDPVALCRLMTYVLMSRTRVVADMFEAQRPTKREFWRRWLAEVREDRAMGYEVSQRVRRRLNEAEAKARRAEQERDRLTAVREKLVALGLDGDASSWQLDRRFGGQDVRLREIARLAGAIAELAVKER